MSRSVVHAVRSDGFAGVERYIAEVAGELASRDWQVTVVGGDPERMAQELPPGVARIPARTTPDVARALWRLGPVDVVHAHMTAAELPAAALRRRSAGRLVITRHFASRRGGTVLARLAGRFVAARIDTQLAISEYVAGAVEGPCTVLHNAVVSSTRAPATRERLVVVAQRLEAEKDTATAVRAWAASGLAHDGWHLEICGRGSDRDALQRLCAESGVASSVRLAGFVSDVRRRYARAAIALATAPAEPFGLSVLEAMAEATPVVAADGGAHRETLGADGRFFAPGDATAAACALRALAADGDTRAVLGRRLQARQRSSFELGRHVDALEDVYRR